MNTIKNSAAFILLMVVLSACKLTKDIATPDAPLPETFRNGNSTEGPTSAAIEWNRFFTDPILQSLIDSALVNNFDMRLALQHIESARLLLNQTRWANAPDVSLQVAATTNRPADNSLNGLSAKSFLGKPHVEDYNVSLNLSWEADIWGKVKNAKAGALAGYLQTWEARKWVQTNIIANVSEGYYNLLMLDAQVQIAKRNLLLSDSTLRIIRLQYDAGQVTALAIQQAEAQQHTAAALLPELEKDIALQENALHILAGSLPDSIQRKTLLSEAVLPDTLSTGVPSELLGMRPDVKSYELELIRANAAVGITRANMYPSLVITAAGGLNAFKASNWFNIPTSLFGLVAGGIVQPVLQKKQLRTAYELAKVDREKAVIAFRQAVLNAVGDVSDALVRIEKLKAKQVIQQAKVKTLQQAIGNAGMLFRSGMANYLEVITAQTNALQSELDLAATARELLSAKIELYRSLGGGWK